MGHTLPDLAARLRKGGLNDVGAPLRLSLFGVLVALVHELRLCDEIQRGASLRVTVVGELQKFIKRWHMRTDNGRARFRVEACQLDGKIGVRLLSPSKQKRIEGAMERGQYPRSRYCPLGVRLAVRTPGSILAPRAIVSVASNHHRMKEAAN